MRLIRGAPGSGKTAQVFREFKTAVAAGQNGLRIVVPTATLVRHFQHELTRDLKVLAPGAVMSMNRFVRECACDTATAPDSLLRLFVRDALRRLDPPEFSGIAKTHGMADIVVESIRLLENAGCEANRFASIRGLGVPAKALARIWAEVDAQLAGRGYVSRPGLFSLGAERAGRLKIWLDGFVSLSPIERSFLRSIASRCEITLTALDDPRDEVRLWAIQCGARDQLLSGPARKPGIVSMEAASPEREADEIARRIIDLRRNGMAYRDIGVAIRDIAAYQPLLETTFDRFGVPARFYFSRPLRSHPAAVFLGGGIRCALTGWDFESALTAMRSHPAWSTTAPFDRFDFAVRQAMPGRGPHALLALAEDEWLKRRLEMVFAIEAWNSQQRTPAGWAAQIAEWANAIYRPGRVDAPHHERDLARLRSHAQGLRSWLDAIDGALPFWRRDAGEIALADFWAVAGDAVDAASLTVPGDPVDAVHVMNALEARQWDLEALFVCGLTDNDYPRKHARHLLLAASDIDKLAREGFRVRTAADQDEEEYRLFRSLESRAQKHLFLTWPTHDAAGRSIMPSQFAAAKPVSRAGACAPMLIRPARVAAQAGRISSAPLLAELASRHANVSITHIESLAQCPFQFFARKTLRLEARPEEPQERIGPWEAGLILHETLENWLKDRAQSFAEVFEQAFDRAIAERHLPRGFRLEVERFRLREIARAVSVADLWPVEYSEAEVDVAFPLIEGVTMTGRVDRVDHIGGNNCVVIDYKSKGAEGMKRLLESETALQGPLYALALRRKFGLNTVAMIYWAVREGKQYGWGAIPGYSGELQPIPPDWEEAAWSRIAARLIDFLNGNVSPAPTHADGCRYCDARNCCRVEETQALEAEAANRGLFMIEAANA